jgi:hypothetical protein
VLAKLNSHHSRCFYSHVKVLLSGGLRHSGGLRPQEPAGLAACACAFAVRCSLFADRQSPSLSGDEERWSRCSDRPICFLKC